MTESDREEALRLGKDLSFIVAAWLANPGVRPDLEPSAKLALKAWLEFEPRLARHSAPQQEQVTSILRDTANAIATMATQRPSDPLLTRNEWNALYIRFQQILSHENPTWDAGYHKGNADARAVLMRNAPQGLCPVCGLVHCRVENASPPAQPDVVRDALRLDLLDSMWADGVHLEVCAANDGRAADSLGRFVTLFTKSGDHYGPNVRAVLDAALQSVQGEKP